VSPRARRSGALAAATLLIALAGGAGSAAAQDGSVEIEVSAVIPERCGFAPSTPPLLRSAPTDLEAAQTFSVALPLDCNTPFAVGLVAERGALTNTTGTPDQSGYAFAKTYGVRVTLDTSVGSIQSARCLSSDVVAGGTCEFATSMPGRGLESGQGIATPGEVTLTIDWPDQSTLTQRLAAGDYSDTITVVVGARA
jgi:hypothetical protein